MTNHANYITSRDLDFELMQAINDVDVARRSKTILSSFAHELAFVGNVDVSKLVHLRNEDGEAFRLYRHALSSALNSSSREDEGHVRQLFCDEVLPHIDAINLTLKNSKKLFLRSAARDVTFALASVGIGLHFGLLEQNATQILAALGGFQLAADMKRKLDQRLRESLDAKKEKYYFLWKVAKAAGTLR